MEALNDDRHRETAVLVKGAHPLMPVMKELLEFLVAVDNVHTLEAEGLWHPRLINEAIRCGCWR